MAVLPSLYSVGNHVYDLGSALAVIAEGTECAIRAHAKRTPETCGQVGLAMGTLASKTGIPEVSWDALGFPPEGNGTSGAGTISISDDQSDPRWHSPLDAGIAKHLFRIGKLSAPVRSPSPPRLRPLVRHWAVSRYGRAKRNSPLSTRNDANAGSRVRTRGRSNDAVGRDTAPGPLFSPPPRPPPLLSRGACL